MANEDKQVGYLAKACVIKPGKSGSKGDKIDRDVVGETVWNDLAAAGALVANPPKATKSKKD